MNFILGQRYSLLRKSLILTIIVAIVCTFLPSHFNNSVVDAKQSENLSEGAKFTKNKNKTELENQRTENSKTFLNSDGTFTTEIYQDPIHYKSSNQWMPIDDNLINNSTDNVLENKANDFKVQFQKNSKSSNLVKVDIKGMSISMDPVNISNVVPNDFVTNQLAVNANYSKNKLSYNGIYDKTDLRYTVGDRKVKEDIILQQKPLNSSPVKYSFKFNVKGLKLVKGQDDRIDIINTKTNKSEFYIEKPYMYDSKVPDGYSKNSDIDDVPEGSRSYDVKMNLVKRGSNYYVDILPDRTWLDDPQRKYPVTIDPTIIMIKPDATAGNDTNIRSYFPTQTAGTESTIGVGLYKDINQTNVIRSLLKFNLSAIPAGANILSAKLNLWLASVSNNTEIGIEAHEVNKPWSETNATWNNADSTTAWTNKGGDYVSTPTDTYPDISYLTDLGVNYKWDLTNLINKWISSGNNGVLLKSNSETTNTYKKFISSDNSVDTAYLPMLAVTYYPGSRLGLENFWTYDTHNLVGGQSYTNMTTGNNIVRYTDMDLKGRGGMGIDFTRFYNSKSVNDSPMGYGWSYTGAQTIVERIDRSKALYTDSDGTTHEFTFNSSTGTYTAPPGTYLKLIRTVDGNGYITGYDLTYKNGLRLHFNKIYNDKSDVYIGNLQNEVDRHGNQITYGYNTSNQLVSITDPTGRQATLTYYSSGRISQIMDFAGRIINYGYDASGNLSTVDVYVDANNYRRTQFIYDTNHHLVTIIDPKGRKTDFTYNADVLQKVQEPSGDGVNADLSTRPGTTYNYDLTNYLSTATDRNGNKTTYSSNSNYVVTKITDPLLRSTTFTMDGNYNPLQIIDPSNNTTVNTYDSNGNVTSTTDAENHKEMSTYDDFSNITSYTDALNHLTTYDYNNVGDLLTITNPSLQKTTYTYDAYGNRTSTTDANNHKTYYGYDTNGINQVSLVDDANHSTIMEYDSADNLTKVTEPNGHVTDYQYNWVDEMKNMDEKVSPTATPELVYTPSYDANGNIQNVIDTVDGVTNNTDYNHTATNDIQSQTVQSAQQINYQYDNNQNLTAWSPQVQWGRGLQFTYDASNQLKQVKDSATSNVIEDYGYDLNGRITSIQRTGADGILQSMSYDKANRLTGLQVTKGSTTIFDYSYSLDDNGRITSVTDKNNVTVSYSYDEAERLKEYTDSTGTTSYTYDAVGNRLTKTSPSGSTSYIYNNLNQLTSRSGSDGSENYVYNTKGELTDNGSTHYEWNTDGKVTKITNLDGSTVSFFYNAKGQRIQKIAQNNAGAIQSQYQYQYDDTIGALIAETNVLTNSTITYSYDSLGRRVSQSQNGNTYYYNYDAHGNVVGLTDSSGSIVATYSYDPWGNLISKTGTLYNPFTYSGYYFDNEVGLYYLINRYYDPVDGRFLSQDAVEPLNANLYVYGNNDPVNNVDPDGNFAWAAAVFFIPGVGEVALGVTAAVAAGIAVGYGIKAAYQYVKNNQSSDNEPIGRANRKKQGREVNEGKKSSKNWKSNPNKNTNRPMKKHTPSRKGHSKY